MNATRTISTSTTNTFPSSPSQMEPVAQAQVQAQAGISSSSEDAHACTLKNGQHFASVHSQAQEPTRRIELDVCLTSSSSTCTIEENSRQQEASFSFAKQHNMMTNHHRPPHTVVSGTSCASSTATNRSIPSTSGVDAAALDKIVELQTSMFRRALPITTDLQNQHRRKPAIKSVVHNHHHSTTTASSSLQRSTNKPQLKPLHSSSSLSSIGSTTVSTSTMGTSKKSKLKRFLAFKQNNKAASSNLSSTVGTGVSYSSCCNQSHSSGSNHSSKRSVNKDGESVLSLSCSTSSKMKSVPVLPAFCLDHNGAVSGGGGSLTSSSSKPRSYHCATTSDLITIMIQSKNDSGDSTSRPPSKIWQPGEDNGPPPRRPSANHTLRLIQLCKRHPSVNDVMSLLKKYPEALKGRNTLGQTPLHVATSVAISAEVILYIFEQDCEAASIRDNCGRYPIHYAARQSNWRSAHAGLFLMMDDDDHDYFYGGHDEDRPDHGMFDDGSTMFAPPVPRLEEEEMDQRHQDVFDYDSDCSTEEDDCDEEEEKKEDTSREGAAACPKSSSRDGGLLDVSGRSGGGVVNYNKSSKQQHKYVDHLLDPMYKCMIKTLAKACPKAINHEDHDGINAIEYAVLDENASMDVIKLMQRTCIRELRRLHTSSRLGVGYEDDLKKSTDENQNCLNHQQPPTILPTSPRSTLTFSARNEVAGRSA